MKQDSNTQLFTQALFEAYDDLGLPSVTMPEDVIARALVYYEKALIYRDTDPLSTPTLIAPKPPSLSKLEHFAGLAMQGMLANPELGRRSAHVIACEARQHSESLLQELQTQGEE